jgi:hypothetical protein
MEFADGGDILHKIQYFKEINTPIPEKDIWICLVQTSKGL